MGWYKEQYERDKRLREERFNYHMREARKAFGRAEELAKQEQVLADAERRRQARAEAKQKRKGGFELLGFKEKELNAFLPFLFIAGFLAMAAVSLVLIFNR